MEASFHVRFWEMYFFPNVDLTLVFLQYWFGTYLVSSQDDLRNSFLAFSEWCRDLEVDMKLQCPHWTANLQRQHFLHLVPNWITQALRNLLLKNTVTPDVGRMTNSRARIVSLGWGLNYFSLKKEALPLREQTTVWGSNTENSAGVFPLDYGNII